MTDYFALLDQPRAPWLDQAKLKEVFRQRTLVEHPDSQRNRSSGEKSDSTFLKMNEAFQVLSDPKRRLHHLLSLEGHAPSSNDQIIPKELHDLFPEIGALSQKTKKLLEETRATSNALSRALLKPRILEAQNETAEVREKLHGFEEMALTELHRINESWVKDSTERIEGLSNLYFVFAYLNRWSAQLDEMAFQLSLL